MRKTEEMLVADLAEQCAQEDQDTFTYTITPERCQCVYTAVQVFTTNVCASAK